MLSRRQFLINQSQPLKSARVQRSQKRDSRSGLSSWFFKARNTLIPTFDVGLPREGQHKFHETSYHGSFCGGVCTHMIFAWRKMLILRSADHPNALMIAAGRVLAE